MSQRFICVDHSSNSPPSSSSSSTFQSFQIEGQDSNKICQWMCCSCGQSYGSIIYTSVDPRRMPSELMNVGSEEPNYKYQGMSKVFKFGILGGDMNASPESIDQKNANDSQIESSSDLMSGEVNTEDTEDNTNKNIILSVPKRFVCHRCHHMMCPYCKKIRLKDLDEKGVNI